MTGFFCFLVPRPTKTRNDMADAITTAIETDAIAGIQKAAVDGQSVEAMPIADRIAAAQFVKSAAANAHSHFGLRMAVTKPQCTQ